MIYTGSIEGEKVSLAAGELLLNCEFKWPEDVQEQYDKWMALIDTAQKADPLVDSNGGRTVDYDYISFYLDTDFSTYDGPMPSSLIAAVDRDAKIKEKIEQCTSLRKVLNTLSELLRYTCVINEDTVIMVNAGGWYTGPDNAWKIRFLTPRNSITRDTLSYVTVEVDDGTDTN